MASFGTIKQTELTSGGNPRRRYEVEEEEVRGAGTKIAGGLLIANAILVFKNVFFSSTTDDARADDQGRQDQAIEQGPNAENIQTAASLKLVHNKEDGKEALEPPENDEAAISSGTSKALNRGRSDDEAVTVDASGLGNGPGVVIPFPTSNNTLAAVVRHDAFQLLDGDSKTTGGGQAAVGSRLGGDQKPLASNQDSKDDSDEADGDRPGNPPRSDFNNLPMIASAVFLGEYFVNQSTGIAMSDLLVGATDADGDQLTVNNLTASSGSLVEQSGGGWTFTPDTYSTERITFSYDISDGEGAVAQTASLDIMELPGQDFFGTELSDTIIATPGSDAIFTYGDDDTVHAREGSDIIDTGAGNDRIIGGQGDDEIYAGAGNDIVFAGLGNDVVHGDDGDDYVSGGEGNDSIFGGAGEDLLYGDEGDDFVEGGSGDDHLSGGVGLDALFGEAGDDEISGGDGNDFVSGGIGDDVLTGGRGNDVIEGDEGADQLHGEAGDDTLIGGIGDDTLTGGLGNDILLGEDGDDQIDGGAGNDIVVAGLGTDEINLGDGDDTAVALLHDGDDTYHGGEGSDTYDASQALDSIVIDLDQGVVASTEIGTDQIVDFEHAVGGAGDDIIIGNGHANVMRGGAGHDIFAFIHGSKSGSGGHVRDRIEDFEVGDRIDVSLFDGNENEEGLQALTFQYDQAEFNGIGQVLFAYHRAEDSGEITLIRFNIDDDDESDFEIEVVGRYDFSDDDFIH